MSVRIASLVPSLTELLFALGLGPHVVARTGFCIHPVGSVRGVPKVGGTKDVNLMKLRRLAPTHVLINIDENRIETAQALDGWPQEIRPELIVTHPRSPGDVPALIRQMVDAFGSIPGVAARAQTLLDELAHELAVPAVPNPAGPVLYLIWRDPWMTVARDTYIARLLRHAGLETLPAVDGGERGAGRYPVVRGDEDWLADVALVLLSSEPYPFDASHEAEARGLCPNARVARVDGELLSWYGPRTAAGLRLARTLVGGATDRR